MIKTIRMGYGVSLLSKMIILSFMDDPSICFKCKYLRKNEKMAMKNKIKQLFMVLKEFSLKLKSEVEKVNFLL